MNIVSIVNQSTSEKGENALKFYSTLINGSFVLIKKNRTKCHTVLFEKRKSLFILHKQLEMNTFL